MPRVMDGALRAAGARYYPWTTRSLAPGSTPGPDDIMIRLICAFDTTDDDIDRFVSEARRASAVHPA